MYLEPGQLSEKTRRSHPQCRSNIGQLWSVAQPLKSRRIKPVIPVWTSAEHDLNLLSSLKSLPFPSWVAKSRCQILLNCWCGFALLVPREWMLERVIIIRESTFAIKNHYNITETSSEDWATCIHRQLPRMLQTHLSFPLRQRPGCLSSTNPTKL